MTHWYDTTDDVVVWTMIRETMRPLHERVWGAVLAEAEASGGTKDKWISRDAIKAAQDVVTAKILAAIS